MRIGLPYPEVMERSFEGASHGFEAHTGEVRMVLRAPDLPGLFAEAARGLAALMVERPEAIEARESLDLSVEGRDAEALLVAWLDELIYQTEVSGKVYAEIEAIELRDGSLSARVRGGPPKAFKTSVKAATFHGLRIVQDEEGARAAVVLDV